MATKRRRRHAEDRALEILGQERAVTDVDVLQALRLWRFRRNKARQNVIPEGGDSFVFSDTLGLVVDRATKQIAPDAASRKNPGLLRLLAAWLRDRQPSEFRLVFPFTSISVNYASVDGK